MNAVNKLGTLQRARNADLVVFFANGLLIATWLSRMAEVKQRLNLTPGMLGIFLLSLSVGALVGLPLAGRIATKLGTKQTLRLGALVSLLGVVTASLGVQFLGTLPIPMTGMFVLGLGIGVADVAQNLEGSVIEQQLGRSIMPWFHAAFSAGTVAGALLSAAAIALGLPIGVFTSAIAVLSVAALVVAPTFFVPNEMHASSTTTGASSSTKPTARERSAWLEKRTLLIGVIAFVAGITEGSASDWLPIAFIDGYGLTPQMGVVALAIFLAAMTAGRLFGTNALDRWGRVAVLRMLFSTALVGSLLVVFAGPIGAFIGVALWGLGASLGFPVGISAAADDPRRAAMRISVVTTLGSMAFIAGPPLIGFVANGVGVLHALIVVAAATLVAIFLAPATRKLVAKPVPQ